MDLAELLSPDDVTGRLLLAVFGPTALIVTVVLAVKVIATWLGPGPVAGISPEDTTDLTALRTAMLARLSTKAIGAVVTALLLVVQIVWLWSTFHIAQGLSYLWHAPFGTGQVDLNGLTSYARSDLISTLYLSASAVALVAAYASAFGLSRRDLIGGGTIVLALPLMLPWGLFCLMGSLFWLVVAGVRFFTDDSARLSDDARAFIAVTLVVVAYTVALHLALSTTRTIAGYWSRRWW